VVCGRAGPNGWSGADGGYWCGDREGANQGEYNTRYLSRLKLIGMIYVEMKNVSLHCPAGKITAIVGDAGAGKTSLLQMLIPPGESAVSLQRGQVWLRGRLSTEWNQKYLRSRLAVLSAKEPVFNVWAGG
jgi:ABC-type Na+ transport system ATPase subunit NatA